MDFSAETSLLAKALWAAALVLGISAIAERVSTRIAGILSGAPQNTLIVFFFVGHDMGTNYVVQSIPHGIASLSATLAFLFTYYRASLWLTRYAVLGSSLIASAAFIAVALVLVRIPFSLPGAVAMSLCAIILALCLFRTIPTTAVQKPVRYSAKLLLLRGVFAMFLVVSVITLAETLGTRWTGLLIGFPAVMLPTLVIIHHSYGAASTHTVIRNFPFGVGSIILYTLSVTITFPLWGVLRGSAVSLAIAIGYLIAVTIFTQPRRAAT
jgi:uncharacterized membrane protein (GlpM family)